MDYVKQFTGGDNNKDADNQQSEQKSEGSSGGGFMDKINGMAGGGAQGEKNEDALDKTVDFIQEKFMGAGDQKNESAAEQAKDEAISDFIRGKYKDTTGKEFVVADKDKDYGV
ncbi:Fc.00g042000.m01.CDS01 [Cosmosporella sp. VM-42]